MHAALVQMREHVHMNAFMQKHVLGCVPHVCTETCHMALQICAVFHMFTDMHTHTSCSPAKTHRGLHPRPTREFTRGPQAG